MNFIYVFIYTDVEVFLELTFLDVNDFIKYCTVENECQELHHNSLIYVIKFIHIVCVSGTMDAIRFHDEICRYFQWTLWVYFTSVLSEDSIT